MRLPDQPLVENKQTLIYLQVIWDTMTFKIGVRSPAQRSGNSRTSFLPENIHKHVNVPLWFPIESTVKFRDGLDPELSYPDCQHKPADLNAWDNKPVKHLISIKHLYNWNLILQSWWVSQPRIWQNIEEQATGRGRKKAEWHRHSACGTCGTRADSSVPLYRIEYHHIWTDMRGKSHPYRCV